MTGGTRAGGGDTAAEDELREVQLFALERRIRASKSLVLFPGKKQGVDVMDTYFSYDEGREGDEGNRDGVGVGVGVGVGDRNGDGDGERGAQPSLAAVLAHADGAVGRHPASNGRHPASNGGAHDGQGDHDEPDEDGDGDQLQIEMVFNEVTEHMTRLTRVNIADGWDVGTTPEAMSDDLLLGLRVGFCGCLSTFSSWNSSMINLLWNGHITQAIVGYIIGLQLPIISYRFGQHVAVYWFVWRRRRETRRAERRGGYGLRLNSDEDYDSGDGGDIIEREEGGQRSFEGSLSPLSADGEVSLPSDAGRRKRSNSSGGGRILLDDVSLEERETPSIRAIATAIFLLVFVLLINSVFFLEDTQTTISLLFSPLGVLTRWRLLKLNDVRPGFPLGTFACNMLGCALSGSLGSLLAGNPGPEESIVLQSMIQGFAGSLSSLAAFVVELLTLIDPIIFKYDGIRYAVMTLTWGMVVGFVMSQAKDWADKI